MAATAPSPPAWSQQDFDNLMQDLNAAASSLPTPPTRLAQDNTFAAAVKAGDVQAAAQIAWQFYQQQCGGDLLLRPGLGLDGEHTSGGWPADMGPGLTTRPSKRAEEESRSNFRLGDWVVVQNVRKIGGDEQLVGHHGQVVGVEAGGWVEIKIPKLSCTARLQQRYLVPLHMGPGGPPGRPAPGAPGGFSDSGAGPAVQPPQPGGAFVLSGPSARHKAAERRPTMSGELSPDTDDSLPRSARRHHFEGYVRPLSIGQAIPPAKVSTLLGRGVSKAREVVRGVRAELLSLEEVVPWEGVDAGWRTRRAAWRKALKTLDMAKPADSLVPAVASALHELTCALLLPISQPPTAPGQPPQPPQAAVGASNAVAVAACSVLARGGAWDTRLQELVAGGNNYQALQHVWDELQEAVRCWLHSQGHALPPPSSPGPPQPPPPPSPHHHHHHHHHHHAHHHHHHHTPPMHHPSPAQHAHAHAVVRCFDKATFAVVNQAVRALQAGVPAASPNVPIGQLAADRVVALGRDASAALRALLAQAEEVRLGTALEAVAAACELGPLLGISPVDLERLSDPEVVLLLCCCPALRHDLRALCVQGPDSEPDTELDLPGEVTDMELSD